MRELGRSARSRRTSSSSTTAASGRSSPRWMRPVTGASRSASARASASSTPAPAMSCSPSAPPRSARMMIAEHEREHRRADQSRGVLERGSTQIRERGYEMMPSQQTAGVYNLSAPVLGADGTGARRAHRAPTSRRSTARRRPTSPDDRDCCRRRPRPCRCGFAAGSTPSRKSRAHDFYLNDRFICDYLRRGNFRGLQGAMQTPIIDTHLHLVDRDRAALSVAGGRRGAEPRFSL